jgi:predicted transcriptional regulator
MIFETDTLNMIINLLNQGLTDRKIAQQLNVSRFSIQKLVKLLKSGKTFDDLTSKKCTKCNKKCPASNFTKRKTTHGIHFCEFCIRCEQKIINESYIGKKFEIFELSSEINDAQIIEIINLRNKGVTSKDTAKILCIDSSAVYKILDDLNVTPLQRANLVQFQSEKVCSKVTCEEGGRLQPISQFAKRVDKNGRSSYDSHCHKCKITDNKVRNNKSYKENPDKWKKYKQNGRERDNKREKQRMSQDPSFKLRKLISSHIRHSLKLNYKNKESNSCLKYLPYSIQELMYHFESLFSHPDNLTSDGKVWMTWENHGNYRRDTWDDNNPSIWTWQIDHIIPQSTLPYTSMEDENFQNAGH